MTAIALTAKHITSKNHSPTVEEARLLTGAARKAGVIHANGQPRPQQRRHRLAKWIKPVCSGEIREISQLDQSTDLAQGLVADHSKMIPVVPDTLDWDLWRSRQITGLQSVYLPFGWRGWWDYGCGAFGDMACISWTRPTGAWTSDRPPPSKPSPPKQRPSCPVSSGGPI